ncbi:MULTISPECIES: hypothetical protein [unclassified Streptomyces]|uniref:hypothetical protein n=1 Tax=unclassified Streptomyces TaxID=2593676 RepID=UPI00336A4FF8
MGRGPPCARRDERAARRVREATEEAGLAVASYGSYYRAGVSDPEEFDAVLRSAVLLGADTDLGGGHRHPRDPARTASADRPGHPAHRRAPAGGGGDPASARGWVSLFAARFAFGWYGRRTRPRAVCHDRLRPDRCVR